jgi:hypothetical protein
MKTIERSVHKSASENFELFEEEMRRKDKEARRHHAYASPASGIVNTIDTLRNEMKLSEEELVLLNLKDLIFSDDYPRANGLRFITQEELIALGFTKDKARAIKHKYKQPRDDNHDLVNGCPVW